MTYQAIVDGDYALHRMAHSPELAKLSTSSGMLTGGVFGSLRFVAATLSSYPVHRCIWVFGSGSSARRRALLPAYRVRPKPETEEEKLESERYLDAYFTQKAALCKILPLLGVRVISVKAEADDVISYISRTCRGVHMIVSDDKDFLAAVSDNVSVYRPMSGELIDSSNFLSYTSLPSPAHYLLLRAVIGDKSDCIPGVTGVGAGTVTPMILSLKDPTVQGLLEVAAATKGARAKKLAESADVLSRNMSLMDTREEDITPDLVAEVERALTSSVRRNEEMAHEYLRRQLEFGHGCADLLAPFRVLA